MSARGSKAKSMGSRSVGEGGRDPAALASLCSFLAAFLLAAISMRWSFAFPPFTILNELYFRVSNLKSWSDATTESGIRGGWKRYAETSGQGYGTKQFFLDLKRPGVL